MPTVTAKTRNHQFHAFCILNRLKIALRTNCFIVQVKVYGRSLNAFLVNDVYQCFLFVLLTMSSFHYAIFCSVCCCYFNGHCTWDSWNTKPTTTREQSWWENVEILSTVSMHSFNICTSFTITSITQLFALFFAEYWVGLKLTNFWLEDKPGIDYIAML